MKCPNCNCELELNLKEVQKTDEVLEKSEPSTREEMKEQLGGKF